MKLLVSEYKKSNGGKVRSTNRGANEMSFQDLRLHEMSGLLLFYYERVQLQARHTSAGETLRRHLRSRGAATRASLTTIGPKTEGGPIFGRRVIPRSDQAPMHDLSCSPRWSHEFPTTKGCYYI